MIFGAWQAILFNDKERLGKSSDFFIQVGEGGFQGFAVIGVGGGREVVHDARAREEQVPEVLVALLLLRGLGPVPRACFVAFLGFNLRFYAFAFPAPGHGYSLTQTWQRSGSL
jgi:hypothetical protein